ncbi:MAG: sulfatase-like hydrolase/transferase [Ginsengibacter sp.]
MKKYFPYLLYFLFWLLFFFASRTVFLMYESSLSATLNAGEILQTFYYGLRMDVSFAAYICIFPFFLFLIKSIFIRFPDRKIIKIYTNFLIVLLSFLVIADLELYKNWGFRMDATPLIYFKDPKEMAGTISSSPIFLLLIIWAVLSLLFIYIYRRFFLPIVEKKLTRIFIPDLLISLLLIGVLFIPIRGGIQKIPMNLSDVYFSKKPFANHAAINLPWNISFSILNQHNEQNPFAYMPEEEAESLVHSLYNSGPVESMSVLNSDTPNIIFIILESFTAKFIGHLGGVQGVTPQLDKIAREGLAFTNIYASGDRSEKGQIAILSGYPNQAITSIIKTPTKTKDLPSINQVLAKKGYTTSFTYGGELEFANIKSYLLNTGFDKLIDKYSFPISQRTTSWGVHDEYVFNRFSKELKEEKEPFFATFFTLSSHEPYDVPLTHFKGKDLTTLFKNSMYYTDSLLGDFIQKSKQESWWNNTLIVLVSDHGHPLPGNDPNDKPSKFHIPLVFTGGALTKSGTVDQIGSQTDIVTTVLNQLNISSKEFPWGKDLLDASAKSFAFYSFNNGFGWVTPNGTATYDNVSGLIYKDPNFDTTQLKFGKAYMQFSYQNFLDR